VIAAVPVRTLQATLAQLDGSLSVPIEIPPGAIRGRGGVQVSLQPGSLATCPACGST